MMRLSPLLLFLPLTAVFADTVKLKSGEMVQGKILDSDASGITIEVQFSPTIKDERHIDRSDIAGTVLVSKDEVAFTAIRDLPPPETALDASVYQDFIEKKLRPFLKEFPTSTRATDIKAKIKSMDADIVRLKAGDRKIGDIWYDSATCEQEKYQVDAAILLDEMKQQIAAKNYVFAMNDFDRLQSSFQNSLAYAESIPLSKKALAKLEQQLTFVIGNLPQTLARRQAAIDRTPPEQRAPIQAAVDSENATATALAEAAQRNNQHFFAILPYDEKGLRDMQQSVVQTNENIVAADQKKLAAGAKLVRRANAELDRHELAAARTTIEQLKSAWPEYEGLGRLSQRLQSSQTSIQESSHREAEHLKNPTP